MARVRQRRDRPGPQCSVSCEVALGYNIRHLVNEDTSAAHGTLSRARLASLFSSQLNVSINRQPFCRLKNHTKYADLQDLRKGTMHFLNLARIKMALYMTLCQWILLVSRSAAGIECCRQARGGLCLMIPWLLWAGDAGHIFWLQSESKHDQVTSIIRFCSSGGIVDGPSHHPSVRMLAPQTER